MSIPSLLREVEVQFLLVTSHSIYHTCCVKREHEFSIYKNINVCENVSLISIEIPIISIICVVCSKWHGVYYAIEK